MPRHASLYLAHLTRLALDRIDSELPATAITERSRVAMSFHFADDRSLKFQDYYVRVTNNRQHFLRAQDFFRAFKTQYALQGVDKDYLSFLEANKPKLLAFVSRDCLVPLYRDYFADARILHKGTLVHKNLGSFFAKFVHTFSPATYCALDNPIRELLGLKRESFFLSFLAVSAAYRTWVTKHPNNVALIRDNIPFNARRYTNQMTDLKLLDLVFWQRANQAGADDA